MQKNQPYTLNSSLMKRLAELHITQRQYYLIYSGIFLIMVPLVFGSFFLNGKSFIWNSDGWAQHYRALVYYAKWLRTIAKTLLFEGRLEIPVYSFSIGEGTDLFTTLHYYVIGDPIAALSVFVPTKYMAWFYTGSILLRYYLTGVSFSMFCFHIARKHPVSKAAVLAGALSYSFCGYALYAGVRHPYFLNPMIYFPLVLLGVEKILEGRKPVCFIAAVFVCSISNFYFFYMIAILTAMYVFWRLWTLYKRQWFQALRKLCTVTCSALVGTGIGALILLPNILRFFASARTESNVFHDFLYTANDYESNIGAFIALTGGHHWTVMGYSGLTLICLILLWSKKGDRHLKAAFGILTGMLLLPVFGKLMNGFSYVSNRWIWAYGMLLAYILVVEWNRLFCLEDKEKRILLASLGGYLLICLVMQASRNTPVFFALSTCIVSLSILFFVPGKVHGIRWAQLLLVLCLIMNLSGNALLRYSPRNANYVKGFIDMGQADPMLNHSEASAVQAVSSGEDDFFRYSGASTTINGSLHSGLHSTQYYWSLENANNAKYREDLALCESIRMQDYITLDARAALTALANVKYYVQNSDVPYGFSHIASLGNYSGVCEYLETNHLEEFADTALTDAELASVSQKITTYQIWENQYFLPFGYTYEGYIPADAYEEMTPLQKQEAMLQGCVIQVDSAAGAEAEYVLTGQEIEYQVSTGEGVTLSDGMFTVSKQNAKATFSFEGLPDSETYLYITGLFYTGTQPLDKYSKLQWELLSEFEQNEALFANKYFEDITSLKLILSSQNTAGTSVWKSLTYYTPQYTYYSNRHDFMVLLGYDVKAKTSVTIQFPSVGTYSFDTMQVLCQPMEKFPEQIAALAVDVMENVDFHDRNAVFAGNTVTGTISLDKAKYLLLTIPYTKGWTAYVDGVEQPILQANTTYMALFLQPGEHEILLRYATPGLKAGLAISLVSLAALLCIPFCSRKKKAHS